MATTPTIVVGRNNWGIKNGNLLGYYQSDDGFFVKREFTATRGGGTNGTFVGSNGLIQTAASGNLPRIDFTGGSPALLVEPSAQNAFIQSQTLFTSHLVQNLTTAGYENVAVSPDGTQNAEKFVPNATNGVHGIADITSQTITSGTTYTFSCFAKSDGGTNFPFISLTLDSSTAWGATRNAIFNVVSGTIQGSAPTGVTMRIENYGNGWYRFSATATAVGSITGTYQYRIYIPNSSATLSYAAASGNTEGVLVWGVQVETGSVATSYIPTTTAPVTRNADVISVTGFTDYIGQTEGTVYLETNALVSGASDLFCFARATTNTVSISKNSSNIIQATVYTSGLTLNIAAPSTVSGNVKIAVAYKTGDSALYINGVQIGTSATAFSFTAALTQININPTGFFEGSGNQRLRTLAIYNTRLSNTELAALTIP